jgi:hypothetical protein
MTLSKANNTRHTIQTTRSITIETRHSARRTHIHVCTFYVFTMISLCEPLTIEEGVH